MSHTDSNPTTAPESPAELLAELRQLTLEADRQAAELRDTLDGAERARAALASLAMDGNGHTEPAEDLHVAELPAEPTAPRTPAPPTLPRTDWHPMMKAFLTFADQPDESYRSEQGVMGLEIVVHDESCHPAPYFHELGYDRQAGWQVFNTANLYVAFRVVYA